MSRGPGLCAVEYDALVNCPTSQRDSPAQSYIEPNQIAGGVQLLRISHLHLVSEILGCIGGVPTMESFKIQGENMNRYRRYVITYMR